MKFIHTADVHLGAHPDSDRSWAHDRAQAITDTFADIIKQTREYEADFLFIAGDLFHHQPTQRDLKEVNYLFSTIPATQVVVIAGNHDRILESSAINSFTFAPNVTYITGEEPVTVNFPELGTDVTGFSYHSTEIPENRLLSIRPPETDNIHILLAHGGDAKHLPIERDLLSASGFTYTALGHIHKPGLSADRRWAYPGSPEPLDRTETGHHGMIAGEISPSTHQVTSLEFIPLSKAEYISLTVHVVPKTTNGEVNDRLLWEIERRGEQNIYRIKLQGRRDPDIEFDLTGLGMRQQIIEVTDETEPRYNFRQLFAEHPGDMIGFYINALRKDEMTPIEKKALYYGIDALLATKDERSQS